MTAEEEAKYYGLSRTELEEIKTKYKCNMYLEIDPRTAERARQFIEALREALMEKFVVGKGFFGPSPLERVHEILGFPGRVVAMNHDEMFFEVPTKALEE